MYSELFESICPFSHVITMQRSDYVEGELTVGERSVELYFAPFSDEESGGVLIVLHDVTEHRKTEERRKEFVANVSHELRTPLTNVRSYAETIREAGDDLSRETENDFLDVVISETDRMTHIVQDLLTLSRLDSGRSEMNMARFPFSAAIDSVLRSTELEARRHKHELTHDYTENLPLIMGDRGRIEQVMLNVLSNAVKYTPDGGHIRVTAGSEGETVWMEVADDGIGMEPEQVAALLQNEPSDRTGIGVKNVNDRLRIYFGADYGISIESAPYEGTTVTIRTPRVPEDREGDYDKNH